MIVERAAISLLTLLSAAAPTSAAAVECTAQADCAPPESAASRTLQVLNLQRVRGPATAGAVLDVGQGDSFDAKWTTCPTVYHDGRIYRMWYSACYDADMPPGGIGLATSKDGIVWERQNNGQPVLEPGENDALDNGQILAPEVLWDGRRFLMWYSGMPHERHESGIGYYRIFLATSPDGVLWQRANDAQPVFGIGGTAAPDAVQAATPTIVRDVGGYRMWYAAWSPTHSHTICAAHSADGTHWQRQNGGQPVRGLDPAYAYGPAVTRYGKQYILVYMGTAHSLFAATSSDGFQWKMLNGGRPILQPAAMGAFDDTVVGHPFLAMQGNRLRIWYTGYRREAGGVGPWKLRIGLAEARLPPRAQESHDQR